MRISLADSLTNGFKKWSDAQRVKSEPAGDAHALPAQERASTIGAEDVNDGPR